MTGILIEASCVVLANAHNPSILNHDWLVRNHIIEEVVGWELAAPAIVTPAVAQLRYQNGVSIAVETNRLVVTLDVMGSRGLVTHEAVREVCVKYVTVLKHVPYTASGNNFKITIECESASSRFLNKFLKNGPWLTNLTSLQSKLIYSDGTSTKNIDIAPASATKATENGTQEVELLVLSGNYHRETDGDATVLKNLACFEEDLKDFQAYCDSVAGDICG